MEGVSCPESVLVVVTSYFQHHSINNDHDVTRLMADQLKAEREKGIKSPVGYRIRPLIRSKQNENAGNKWRR